MIDVYQISSEICSSTRMVESSGCMLERFKVLVGMTVIALKLYTLPLLTRLHVRSWCH